MKTARKVSHSCPSLLRIVHVVSSLQVGGMEQFVIRLASAQRQNGHQAEILALKNGALAHEAQRLDIPVTVLSGHKLMRILSCITCFVRLKPNIIHAHNQSSLHYGRLGKWVTRAPLVMTNHGQGMGSNRTPSEAEWDQTDSIIAVSNAVADRMDRGLIGSKLETIYNGIELATPVKRREQVRTELGIEPDRIIAIMVARIDHLKGHETLINALGELRLKKLALTVLIVGDGEQRAAREEQAKALGLDDTTIRFLGFRSDIPDLLAASDLFVLPSLTEGLPLSVLEAMSHGLPILATPVGGIPELVSEGQQGVLVPVQDVAALAEAFLNLVPNAAQRQAMGQAAYDRVRTSFAYPQMLAKYEALYHRLRRSA